MVSADGPFDAREQTHVRYPWKERQARRAKTPMKRPAQPEEIAPAYVFLASPHCSNYITGEILPIIGGSPAAEAPRRPLSASVGGATLA
jgi:NAD(P)-dependent dehydrogenase (short-subunit alcohol dehydrogenase family)